MDRYCCISNSLSRLLSKLGARITGSEQRRGPAVAEYAAAKQQKNGVSDTP